MRLFLDLSTSSYLALEDGEGHCLASEVHQPPLRNEAVLGRLEALLQGQGCAWDDLKGIAVGSGPGSFTGIRVAISLAQGLAFAKSLPIHPFHNLAALQWLFPGHAVGIAAHGGRWYWRWAGEDVDRLLTASDVRARQADDGALRVAVTGGLPKGWLEKPEFPIASHLETDLDWTRLLAFVFSQPPAPLGIVRPQYVQASAAEAKRRQTESEPWIRPWRAGDLPALAELERRCNPQPWTLAQWQSAFQAANQTRQAHVLSVNGECVGYGLLQEVVDEVEVQLLGIHPDWRRRGMGRLLLQSMLRDAASRQVAKVHLEVRAGNADALRLYAALGFSETGRRRDYYADPREDAVLMAVHLASASL
jgi:[ribosomal protein S18]-alanine N-acetyltransferase